MLQLNYQVPITESGMMGEDFIIQGVAINATITANNHKFLSEELRSSASSLTGVPLLVDHDNRIECIKGRVILGEYDETNSRINFKAKVVNSDIKQMIKEGLINSVSVGAACSSIEEEGDVLVPRGISFKELSLVAVPADSMATFAKAMQEAYKLQPKEAKIEVKPMNDALQEVNKIIAETPKMCEDPFKEILDRGDLPTMKSQLIISSTEESLKGGMKMSEEIIKTEQVDMKAIQEVIESLKAKITALESAKVEVKVEAKEEISEKPKYNITQGLGSLKGSSFSLVR